MLVFQKSSSSDPKGESLINQTCLVFYFPESFLLLSLLAAASVDVLELVSELFVSDCEFSLYCILSCRSTSLVNSKVLSNSPLLSTLDLFPDTHCLGFGWDRVNFLLSSWYSAVFWI